MIKTFYLLDNEYILKSKRVYVPSKIHFEREVWLSVPIASVPTSCLSPLYWKRSRQEDGCGLQATSLAEK